MIKAIVRSRAYKIVMPVGLGWAIVLAGCILPMLDVSINPDTYIFWLFVCIGWTLIEIYFSVIAYLQYEARQYIENAARTKKLIKSPDDD